MENLSIFTLSANRRLRESNSVWLAYIQSTAFSDGKRLMKKEITSEKMTEINNSLRCVPIFVFGFVRFFIFQCLLPKCVMSWFRI